MRKFIYSLLCLLLCFSVLGCSVVPDTSGQDITADTTASDISLSEPPQTNTTAVTTTPATTIATTPVATTATTPVATTVTTTTATTAPVTTTTTPPAITTPATTKATTPESVAATAPEPVTTTTPAIITTTTPAATTTIATTPATTTVATTTTPLVTEPPIVHATPEDTSPDFTPEITGSIEYKNKTSLPQGIEQLLLDYYDQRYYLTGKLWFNSLNRYFDLSSVYGILYSGLNDTVLEYLIYARQQRELDFRYKTAEYTITVKEVAIKNGEYIVTYDLAEAINFNCLNVTSYSCGMEVVSRMIKTHSGDYLFTQVAEDTDANILVEREILKSMGLKYGESYLRDVYIPHGTSFNNQLEKILANLKTAADKDIANQKKMRKEYNKNPAKFKSKLKADHAYNREKAVEYSYKYAGKTHHVRNPEYTDYSPYGGNCQHYASQAIHYSGVPMDWSGDKLSQWKWFDTNINNSETPTGRSLSWAVVGYFYDYCINNAKKGSGKKVSGLVTEPDINIYAAQKGDIMQYYSDNWGRHTVIVSDIVYDKKGNVKEILINSNTTDHINYPLTAYGYTDVRLIHIIGWND